MKKKVKRPRQKDPRYTCYLVIEGRELGIFTEPIGAYNSIKGFEDAICFSIYSFEVASFIFKERDRGNISDSDLYNQIRQHIITEDSLLEEINRIPKRISEPYVYEYYKVYKKKGA